MKYLATILIALALTVFVACGSDTSAPRPVIPAEDPPRISNTIGFSCLSVDNDQVCAGIETSPGIWNSGPVAVTGYPPPDDYINIEVVNDMAVNTTVFVYSLVTISGCGDNPIAFKAVTMAPGDVMILDYRIWNYRCGWYGYQQTDIQIYNAAGFDPADYANPWMYPRTDLIDNAVVQWENRAHGDIP